MSRPSDPQGGAGGTISHRQPVDTLTQQVPAGTTLVAESGLSGRADLDRLSRHGVNAFLIGESLMRQPDVEAATRALLES